MSENNKNEEVGVLWEKQTKNGDLFFSGIIKISGENRNIVAFTNREKMKKNQPDFKIYWSNKDKTSQ